MAPRLFDRYRERARKKERERETEKKRERERDCSTTQDLKSRVAKVMRQEATGCNMFIIPVANPQQYK